MNTQFSIVKAFFLSAVVALGVSSCSKKDKTDPAPAASPVGTLLTYTNIPSSEFDKIEVVVDGVVMGTITAPYSTKPECGAESSSINTAIKLTPGKHSVYAIQYKGGSKVGEWEAEDETIQENKCTKINWVD